MSKRIDPIVQVLRYFEGVDLPLAEQGLALAKDIVRKRQPLGRLARREKPVKAKRAEDGVTVIASH